MDHVDPLRGCRPVRVEELEDVQARRRPSSPTLLAYDVYRSGDELVIEFDVPGVDPSAIELATEGSDLVVSVRRGLARGDAVDVVEARRQHGHFTERLQLGSRWSPSRLRARVEHGVLTVRAPVAEGDRRTIPVDVGATRPVDDPSTRLDDDQAEAASSAA
jgi:HSP20 family protein